MTENFRTELYVKDTDDFDTPGDGSGEGGVDD